MFRNSLPRASVVVLTALTLVFSLSFSLGLGLISFKANAITDFEGLDDKGNSWKLVEMSDGVQITRTLPEGHMLIYTAEDFTCGEHTDKKTHKVTSTLDMSIGNSYYTFMTVIDTTTGEQISAISLSVNKRSYHSELSKLKGHLCDKVELKGVVDGK